MTISSIQLGKMYINEYYEDSKWGAVKKQMYVVPVQVQQINAEDKLVYYYEMERPEKIIKEYDDIAMDHWKEPDADNRD